MSEDLLPESPGDDPSGEAPIREHCRRILTRGDLASKLAPVPVRVDIGDLAGPSVEEPVRDDALRLGSGANALPRPGALVDPRARALCLARFAHHELMAVELFAWALLRWPDLPAALQREWLTILRDEQRHCALYLERLAALGDEFADHAPHSDYFWQQAQTIASSPAGPRAFLAAMGLTLEQANLDFTLLYRDAFAEAGDPDSARVCQQVHDDEIRHVRSALDWLERLSPGAPTQIEAYEEAVPFPLSASRAKGRRFDVAARRAAGLEADFIEHVRVARSNPERGLPRPPTPRRNSG